MRLRIPFLILFLATVLGGQGCGLLKTKTPPRTFAETPPPPAPDYAHPAEWAAHPAAADAADRVPRGADLHNGQDSARIDVFYIYPTLWNSREQWNAPTRNRKFCRRLQNTVIRQQASVYNGTCRVYAPYYRQAAMAAYSDSAIIPNSNGEAAFNLAYEDVRRAFRHYLEHENNGRPFIIAGHSQGSQHGLRLLREEVAGQPCQSRLVAGYLLGLPNRAGWLAEMPYCQDSTQTGCWLTWNCFREPLRQSNELGLREFRQPQQTNPISFRPNDAAPQPTTLNRGSLTVFNRIARRTPFGATVQQQVITVGRRGRFGLIALGGDYHIMDYHLFWMNLRHNIALRTERFSAPSR